MAVKLGRRVLDGLLLGPENRRRQLQDFPVLGDVWASFAEEPDKPQDLLIIPTRERPTPEVVALIAEERGDAAPEQGCGLAYIQDLVVASFRFEELYTVLIPATCWWDRIQDDWQGQEPERADLARWIETELRALLGPEGSKLLDQEHRPPLDAEGVAERESELNHVQTKYQQAAKLGLLLGTFIAAANKEMPQDDAAAEPVVLADLEAVVETLSGQAIVEAGLKAVLTVIERHEHYERSKNRNETSQNWNGVIFQVTLNRPAEAALAESVPAIKADAARLLFSIKCGDIGWAVVDSGIDHTHDAFIDFQAKPNRKNKTRIKAAYEFRRIRAILSVQPAGISELAKEIAEYHEMRDPAEIVPLLQAILDDRIARRPVDWAKIRRLVTIDLERTDLARPDHPHGTHVAGIIGANWRDGNQAGGEAKLEGVCPDITLFDFRVLGHTLGDSEFAVSAALQFIRYLNEQSGPRIHGANLSLAIRHDVRNYACGRTPVCIQAESLVANGVVIVAAAGNRGYQSYLLADSTRFENFAPSTITDPGNADGVITVGSTHRQWPHTYGVSFFSSRGPTGDGRLKPDLLAPGEKIVSCIPGSRQDQMDGTSMAAPHVSGAAALLMARHQELRGQPARIKEILCSTATDLRRERTFQGHGMVDVLRAIQSV